MKYILILLLITTGLFAADKKVDLSGIITFKWGNNFVGVIYSMSKVHKIYNIRIDHDHKNAYHQLKISILKDNKVIFKFDGHSRTSFFIQDDKIYYSEFNQNSSGCKIHAYDLKTKKKLWATRLRGNGPVMHFAYGNSGVRIYGSNTITIHGRESFGDYSEILDIKTGKFLANKIHSKGWKKSTGKK